MYHPPINDTLIDLVHQDPREPFVSDPVCWSCGEAAEACDCDGFHPRHLVERRPGGPQPLAGARVLPAASPLAGV